MSILGITCMRDDGPYLAEWIAHHLAAGVDRMLVYSHDCTDGSDALMDALAADARVAHVRFDPKGRKSVQWQALKLAQDHAWYKSTEWALFFDCDEFLSAPAALPDMIASFEQDGGAFDALALPWRLYGSGGHERRGTELTPERFTQAAPLDLHFPLAHLFKTLHRPKAFRQLGVHRPRAKSRKPAKWIGPDGGHLPEAFARNDTAMTLYGMGVGEPQLWLNHYSVRSIEEFLVKRMRGLPNHMDREIGLTYWAERNWNTDHAPEALKMMPATRLEFAKLMSLPDVAQLHADCIHDHIARYQSLIGDLDTLRLAFRLGLLTGSTPPSEAAGRRFIEAQIGIMREQEAK